MVIPLIVLNLRSDKTLFSMKNELVCLFCWSNIPFIKPLAISLYPAALLTTLFLDNNLALIYSISLLNKGLDLFCKLGESVSLL